MNNEKYNDCNNEIEANNEKKSELNQQEEVKLDASLDISSKKIIELEEKLVEIEKNERNNFLRFRAEIENIHKRSEQHIEKAYKFALEKFIFELLPVLDNLNKTTDILNQFKCNDQNLNSIIEGIKLTLKSLHDTTIKFGLTSIENINIPFNPEIHQAIAMSESDDKPNQVIQIIQKGYMLHEKLIRPASVIVSVSKKLS